VEVSLFMVAVSTKYKRPKGAPDLSEYRKRYPLTVANFGTLANREAWLDQVWRADVFWQQAMKRNMEAKEAIVRGAPPKNLSVEGEFEIIYAGGVLGLLHAAVMSSHYKRRVMVFDEQAIGESGRDWNLSDDELRAFECAGAFTRDEIESVILNRSRSGFVKFHDVASRVKTPPLWIEGVLNVSINADRLLALASAKLERSETRSALMSNVRFVRCYIQKERVVVEVEETGTKKRMLFGARLFVDASGANSRVARQLNERTSITHVCPTVGTVARGFVRGFEPNQVDFNVGEILVSRDDARDHRQLIWEGFGGNKGRDEYATRLFFYDAVDSPADKSLLALFERYFEQLPGYKRAGAQWRVMKPVFGYVPSSQDRRLRGRRCTADERVMLLGDAASLSSPLPSGRNGLHIRTLQRITHLTDLALSADLLDASSLSEINMDDSRRVAEMSALAEFLRPTPKSAPATVNETLNAVMAALHSLDERVRRELFQDRISFSALKRLLSRTAKLYPRIFQRVREHFGARGAFWWLAQIATAAFKERRAANSLPEEDQSEDAAQTFARYLSLYKNQHGAGNQH
jgi:lycopene cyclase CruA